MPDAELTGLRAEMARLTAELEQAHAELIRKQCTIDGLNDDCSHHQQQIIYQQKMASLGALVAGITHEIKTPIGAINSMQDTLSRALDKLKGALDKGCPGHEGNRPLSAALKIIEDASHVIGSGSERTLEIVRRVRKFAHLGEHELAPVDLHAELDDTLLLLHHELKDRISVDKRYGELPKIVCNAGQINQVFLNVLVNAAQAIEGKGAVTIATSLQDRLVRVAISDTGAGIPPEVIERIFETGFTTKKVGVGTGLGLSICSQIVQEHGGAITLESEVGKGTTFTITLAADLEPTNGACCEGER
jgi:two-component system NtrC family sensor kinase